MKTRIMISLMLVVIFTAIFFSGCSLDLSSAQRPNGTHSGGMGDITTGIVSGNSNDVGKDDLGKVPDVEGMDEKDSYKWMQGIKIAYDSTNKIIETSQKSYCENLIKNLTTEFINGYENFNINNFLSIYPSEEYGISEVSQGIWIYNLIEQYQLFSKIILSDIYGNFGKGYGENHTVCSVMYPKFNFVNALIPTSENKDAINFKALERITSIQFENPNYNTAFEYNTEQFINFDLQTKNMSIGSSQWVVELPDELVTKFSSWKLNLNTNSENVMYEIANPIYNELAEAGDLCALPKLYIIGQIADGVISYSLSTTPIIINNLDITQEECLIDYIDKYYNYLAYKIFENSSLISATNQYAGNYETIKTTDIIKLIPNYLKNGGKLGFVEKNWIPKSVGDFDFVTNVTNSIMTNFVGYEDSNIKDKIKEIIINRLNQYVLIDRNEAYVSDKAQENSQLFFPVCHNIEWKDYSLDELFNKDDPDGFEAQYGNILDVVFMVNENLEVPRFFDSLWLTFMAKENNVDLKTYFRYVQSGEEKIFNALDYKKMSESTQNEESEDLNFASKFNGKIEKIEGKSTMEYADAHTLYLTRDCTPKINEFVNKELLFNSFKNNCDSTYIQCCNIKNNYYQYDSIKKSFYFGDNDAENDYIELVFDAKTGNLSSPFYSFSFCMFGLEEKKI